MPEAGGLTAVAQLLRRVKNFVLNAACPQPLKHSEVLTVNLCQSMQTLKSKMDTGHRYEAHSIVCKQRRTHPGSLL